MQKLFGGKKDIKEDVKAQNRVLRGAERDIERDRTQLEREQKRIELEIKKLAKQGNKQACVILAKQLVQIRKQQTRSYQTTTKIGAIKTQNQIVASNMKLGEAIGTTAKTMGAMNKLQDPAKTAKMLQEFEKQNMKMDMTDEMINDTLDGVLEGSDDEAESDAIVNRVLDEIGIEIEGKLINAPTPTASGTAQKEQKGKGMSDADIEKLLAELK